MIGSDANNVPIPLARRHRLCVPAKYIHEIPFPLGLQLAIVTNTNGCPTAIGGALAASATRLLDLSKSARDSPWASARVSIRSANSAQRRGQSDECARAGKAQSRPPRVAVAVPRYSSPSLARTDRARISFSLAGSLNGTRIRRDRGTGTVRTTVIRQK
jgi:hypothetical protein